MLCKMTLMMMMMFCDYGWKVCVRETQFVTCMQYAEDWRFALLSKVVGCTSIIRKVELRELLVVIIILI
jgi:hypothetical protein